MFLRVLLNGLRWVFLGLALLFLGGTALASPLALKIIFWVLGIFFALLAVLFFSWYLRPNGSRIAPELGLESWNVTNDDQHNSNTDMLYWQGAFYLVHAVSPFHFASQKCHLVLLRSPDARRWEQIARFEAPGEDIRDPKLAVIRDRLFLYALKNRAFNPEPYTSVVTFSLDGKNWEPMREVEPKGWLFWRPKTRDGQTWYQPAYWWEHGHSALFSSVDGIHWIQGATIYTGDRDDENDFEFLPDGRMLATGRLEYSENIFGDRRGSTLIAVAEPPYKQFDLCTRSPVTRLDGPNLFGYHGSIYAVGRYQPELHEPFTRQGSAFSRKRTALFQVKEDGLTYLSDLPSAGDTSYSGLALRGDDIYICYYTSDVGKDYPWIVGMANPTAIKMARISASGLESLASQNSQR